MRVGFVLRSTEIKPLFQRFVLLWTTLLLLWEYTTGVVYIRPPVALLRGEAGHIRPRTHTQHTRCLSAPHLTTRDLLLVFSSLSPSHPICYWPCLLYCCDRLNIVSLVLIARLLLLGLDMCDFRKVHCATFGRCGVGRARDARASPGEHTQKGWSCRSACSNAKSHKEKSKVHLAAARARARWYVYGLYSQTRPVRFDTTISTDKHRIPSELRS